MANQSLLAAFGEDVRRVSFPRPGGRTGAKTALQNSWHLLEQPLLSQGRLSIRTLPATQDCGVSPEVMVRNVFAELKGQSRGAKLFLAPGLLPSRCPVNSW